MNADTNISGKAIAVVIAFKGIFGLPAVMFLPWYFFPFCLVMIGIIVLVALEAREKETEFRRKWRNFIFRIKQKRNEMGLGSR